MATPKKPTGPKPNRTGAKLSAAIVNQYNGLVATLRRDCFLHADRFTSEEREGIDFVLTGVHNMLSGGGSLAYYPRVDYDLNNAFDVSIFWKYKVTGDFPNAQELIQITLFRDWLFLTLENL